MTRAPVRRTLVLLPGLGCDERLFAPQAAALAGCREVIVPRLVGSDSMAGLAARVLAGLPTGSFDLAGLSMGGILALEMVRQAPSRVRRLALLDTTCKADIPERRAIRDRQIAAAAAGHLREVVAGELLPLYLGTAHRHDEALLDLLLAMAIDLGPAAFIEQTRALQSRADATQVLAGFGGPVLVLCGAEDRLCPPGLHAEMAGLARHAELHVLPGAGHVTSLEQPDQVAALLRRWLDRPLAGEPRATGR